MPFFGVPIRNGLPIGLGSSAGFGIAPFEPYSLFENGEQGAWYDPSDYSTLFQDSAGTTPVTGVEQFVGLMLDKSKGLVLGPELVTNPGPFANTTGWTGSNATIASSGGKLVVTDTGGLSGFSAYQAFNVTAGKWYKLSTKGRVVSGTSTVFQIAFRNTTDASTSAFLGGFNVSNPVTGVTYEGSAYYYATSTATVYLHCRGFFSSAPVLEYEFANVSELPGNHAFQTSSAKRPKLAARYNLLTYSEEFDNGAWTKTTSGGTNPTVTPNTEVAPNGTLTADTYAQTATPGNSRITQDVTIASGQTVTLSVSQKQKTGTWGRLLLIDASNTNGCSVYVNLATGQKGAETTFGSGAVLVSASVVPQGNGWYRITLTGSTTGTTARFFMDIVDADGSTTRLANGEMYLWGADLRPASQATGLIGPAYQRVAAATVYDTAGFLPYLAFDGLDDSMGTNNIVPGTDKVQVFAGVRKLSDSGTPVIVELSADSGTNNGVFAFSNGTPIPEMFWRSKGTLQAAGATTGWSSAPSTFVATGIGDISGDVSSLYENRVIKFNSTADQGTGNYLTYPLFIGMRNNASFPFNGWLSSLIVRFGPNLSTSTIQATESWVAGKTGVSI